MRYVIDSADGGDTWYVIDFYDSRYLKQAYENKYAAQDEADRLNKIEEKE